MVKKSDKQEIVKIAIADAIIIQEKIWFCARNFNSLFCMDMITKKVELVGIFPNEPYNQEILYTSMKLVGEKIYFIPYHAKTIAVYDIIKKQFSNIDIEQRYISNLSLPLLFSGVEKYKNYLFILPLFAKAILKLNTDTQEIEYISNWIEDIKDKVFNERDIFFKRQAIIQENKLLVPFSNVNAVLELNCDTLESNIYMLGREEQGYSGISYDGKDFWLTPRASGDLTIWNYNSNNIRVIKMCKEKINPYAFVGALFFENQVMVFPEMEEEYVLENSIKTIKIQRGLYSFIKEENNNIIYYDRVKNILTIINKKDKNKEEIEFILDSSLINLKQMVEEKGLVEEQEEVNLKSFLSLVVRKDSEMFQEEGKKGKDIYQKMK